MWLALVPIIFFLATPDALVANPSNPVLRRNLAMLPLVPPVAQRVVAGSAIAPLLSVDLADDMLEAAFRPRIAS